MGEKRVVVPQGMKAVAAEAWREMFGHGSHHGEVDAILRPALLWLDGILSEQNPDFHQAILKRGRERYPDDISMSVAFEFGASFARQYVSGLFVEPEPEVTVALDDIKDMLLHSNPGRESFFHPEIYNQHIIEAYRRGKKAAKK